MSEYNKALEDVFDDLYVALQDSKAEIMNNEKAWSKKDQAQQDAYIQALVIQYKTVVSTFTQNMRANTTAYYHDMLEEARYLLTIFIDETFIGFKWFGQSYWTQHLLEYELFNTYQAGDLFFEKLDGLLLRYDATQKELATLYAIMLSLGFQGKYRGSSTLNVLQEYREKLAHILGLSQGKKQVQHAFLLKQHIDTVVKRKNILGYRYSSYFMYLGMIVLTYLLMTGGIWEYKVGKLERYSIELHSSLMENIKPSEEE